jgi:hypothetical protein
MKKPTLPPRENLIRLPSAFIPQSLLKRVKALLTYRGDYTKFVIDALTHEVERQEKEKSNA